MKKFECECGTVDSDGLFLDGGNGWNDEPEDTFTWHCVECVGQKYDKRGKRIAELEAKVNLQEDVIRDMLSQHLSEKLLREVAQREKETE